VRHPALWTVLVFSSSPRTFISIFRDAHFLKRSALLQHVPRLKQLLETRLATIYQTGTGRADYRHCSSGAPTGLGFSFHSRLRGVVPTDECITCACLRLSPCCHHGYRFHGMKLGPTPLLPDFGLVSMVDPDSDPENSDCTPARDSVCILCSRMDGLRSAA
jgi:hypothetical protein